MKQIKKLMAREFLCVCVCVCVCVCRVCACMHVQGCVWAACVCVHVLVAVYYCVYSFCLGKRQTVLFSATQTRNVEDLARISLKKAPLYVGVDDHRDTATVEGLEQVSVFASTT